MKCRIEVDLPDGQVMKIVGTCHNLNINNASRPNAPGQVIPLDGQIDFSISSMVVDGGDASTQQKDAPHGAGGPGSSSYFSHRD